MPTEKAEPKLHHTFCLCLRQECWSILLKSSSTVLYRHDNLDMTQSTDNHSHRAVAKIEFAVTRSPIVVPSGILYFTMITSAVRARLPPAESSSIEDVIRTVQSNELDRRACTVLYRKGQSGLRNHYQTLPTFGSAD